MERSFFGLPRIDDPSFGSVIAERNINLLSELRYVAREVGYREAFKMPVEVRQWWITEMQKDAQQKHDDQEARSGRRTVPVK